MGLLSKWIEEGANPFEIYSGVINHIRSLLFLKMEVREVASFYDRAEIEQLTRQSAKYDYLDLVRMLQISLDFENIFRQSLNTRIALELLILRLGFMEKSVRIEDLIKHFDEGRKGEAEPGSVEGVIKKLKEAKPSLGSSLERARVNLTSRDEIEFVFGASDKYHKEAMEDEKNSVVIEKALEEAFKHKMKVKVRIEEAKPEAKDAMLKKMLEVFDGEEIN